MKAYNPHEIEPRLQLAWEEAGLYTVPENSDAPKKYVLEMFPYPSGDMHMGHASNYTYGDVVARYSKMQGFDVLHPMGWDAFGLPAENAAIKHHSHPAIWTYENIETQKKSFSRMGFSYDWDRKVVACDPEYYRWGQWIFLKFWERGLVERRNSPVNWCPSCGTVLANEQVIEGRCWRCDSEVEKRDLTQWYYKITDYAQELLDDLDQLEGWPERVKQQQANWIGRSEGANVDFILCDRDGNAPAEPTEDDIITVFTTRPDTLFGATYMVLSPEHPLLERWMDRLTNADEVKAYQEAAAAKSDFERTELTKEKTGVQLGGVKGINPVNGKEIPIFISDYVLSTYGTGAIMAVPAHDDRDWEFAKKFGCEIIEVVSGGEDVQKAAFTAKDETGILVNSDFLNGKTVKDAIPAMIEWLGEKGIGRAKVQYKLRDWVFSRQRYWGEPIPIVKCDKCGYVPLPEDQLPLELPNVHTYEPTDNGESPLAHMTDWVNTTCPCCGGPAKRETDTMPQWAGSSWYFLRYMDPHNDKALASPEALKYWSPVDWYNGGMEHTTLHLLYSRFWHKFLYDIGVVPTKEPYAKRTSHGMILGENGEKMSKSRGNVVNPDEIVDTYGADTMRLYEMFIGDFEKAAPWSPKSIKGCRRFLERVWSLADKVQDGDEYSKEHEALMHRTIKKVGEDADNLKANTAIAALMTMLNEFYDKGVNKAEYKTFLALLNPFAPHITEELWQQLGENGLLSVAPWPQYDESKTVESTVEMAVQVNGKLKGTIKLAADADKQAAIDAALAEEKVQHAIEGKQIVKQIVVPGKIVNIVVK